MVFVILLRNWTLNCSVQFVGITLLVNDSQFYVASFHPIYLPVCGWPNCPAKEVWLWYSYRPSFFGCLLYVVPLA